MSSSVKKMPIRVRFAPSPTGNLHIGSARTALFNWLFAKANKGTFIVRIEDTDYDRSMEEYVLSIIDGLEWLGLGWDEGPAKDGGSAGKYGPYRQSQRLDIYKDYAKDILKNSLAYKCFCTDKELEAKRVEDLSKGRPPKYDGACLKLSDEEIRKRETEGIKPVYRFKMPNDIIHVEDLIRGSVKFDCSLIGDFVIIKSDGTPSYNFAAVIDDHLMKISHVIRGEDHLSNTPRQIMLYRALGLEPPKFAHLPIILGTDRSKLSKRHGALSISEYRKEGYLPEAMFNYLALLGWSPKNEKEIISQKQLIKSFALGSVSRSGSVFDVVKLKWMNGQYMRKMKVKEIVPLIKPYLTDAGFKINDRSDKWLAEMVEAVIDNISLLSDIKTCADIFFNEVNYEDIKGSLYHQHTADILKSFEAKLSKMAISHNGVNRVLEGIAKSTSQKKGVVFRTIREVLTGRPSGPELWRVIKLYGKEKTLLRIKKALGLRKI